MAASTVPSSGNQLNQDWVLCSPAYASQNRTNKGWAVHRGCTSFHCLLGENCLEGAARLSWRPQWDLCLAVTGCRHAGRKRWSSSAVLC